MTMQNYLIIESNVVTNNVLWDGNLETWTPPAGSIQLIDETTPAKIWQPVYTEEKLTDWVLEEQLGVGDIGFTWDGNVLTTNEPKPAIPS
jgi:hypothetical protein